MGIAIGPQLSIASSIWTRQDKGSIVGRGFVRTFEQSISIAAPIEVVDRCIVSPDLMGQWLNPMLKCESVGDWSVEVGDRFRFKLRMPLLEPALECVVAERRVGLVVWDFAGFFTGSDRWECQPQSEGTLLLNQFSFEIPNPLVAAGFELGAAQLTQRDMRAQLRRLQAIAEELAMTRE
ncbi:SRPBCC family protein [Synechococcus sp. PCC 7336]|uniref:SRPBCC family protein n=1 Tax=Synechococcus sp. PCC 7336 TaxID=195250 RepID=UPI00034874DB